METVDESNGVEIPIGEKAPPKEAEEPRLPVQEMLKADDMKVEYVGRFKSPEEGELDHVFTVEFGPWAWKVAARYREDNEGDVKVIVLERGGGIGINELRGGLAVNKMISRVPNRARARDNDDLIIMSAMIAALHSERWLEFVKARSEADGK